MSCSTNSTVRPSSRSDFTWPSSDCFSAGLTPGHRLVEHHQLGVGHQRARHLEQLALPAGQRPGEVLALLDQQEALEQRVGPLGVGVLLAAPQRREHRRREGPRPRWPVAPTRMFSMTVSLESTLVSWKVRTMPIRATLYAGTLFEALAVERPAPVVGPVEAGEQVEEGGLAGAVGADQRGDDAALDLDVLDVDGGEAAERAHDVVGDHDRVGLGGPGSRGDVRQRRRAARCRRRSAAGPLVGARRHGVPAGVVVSGHRAPAPFGRRRSLVVGRSSTASARAPGR